MNTFEIEHLVEQYPLVKKLINLDAVTWFNPNTTTLAEGLPYVGLTQDDVTQAEARLKRFAPYLCLAFPETQKTHGIIESEVVAIPEMQAALEQRYQQKIAGQLMLKKDSHLPISGSIKARGGIYEVLTLKSWPLKRECCQKMMTTACCIPTSSANSLANTVLR